MFSQHVQNVGDYKQFLGNYIIIQKISYLVFFLTYWITNLCLLKYHPQRLFQLRQFFHINEYQIVQIIQSQYLIIQFIYINLMSQIEKQSKQLLNQNDCTDFELTYNNNQIQKNTSLSPSESINKIKVFDHDQYSYQESQHTRLIGDLATADKQLISSSNWKDSVRKQYGVQKCQEYADPSELNNRIKLFIKLKSTYMYLLAKLDKLFQQQILKMSFQHIGRSLF
ncbi:hypothetical protein pb186bvf_013861 [Paramecium bursaria]